MDQLVLHQPLVNRGVGLGKRGIQPDDITMAPEKSFKALLIRWAHQVHFSGRHIQLLLPCNTSKNNGNDLDSCVADDSGNAEEYKRGRNEAEDEEPAPPFSLAVSRCYRSTLSAGSSCHPLGHKRPGIGPSMPQISEHRHLEQGDTFRVLQTPQKYC